MRLVTASLPYLLVALSATMPMPAQTSNAETSPRAVKVGPVRQIRKNVDAWPLIVNANTPAAKRVNEALAKLNRKMEYTLKTCDGDYKQWAKIVDQTGETGLTGDWTREVKVTMQGPSYLSLVATNGFFCGGAHPYMFTEVVVFTLEIGAAVDPIKLFKPGSHVSYADVEEPGPPLERSISAPDLVPTYKELTKHDCDDLYAESQPFLIWPDAATGQVMIEADALPGCCQACGEEVGLSIEQARKLGFTEDFLGSIQQAHDRYMSISH